MSSKNRLMASVAGLAFAALSAAQTGVYYLSAPTQSVDFRFQGGSVLNSWSQGVPGESAIAVAGDIRSIGIEGGFQGSKYSLAGADSGTRFANPVAGSLFYDGASDGSNNYSVDFVSHAVYRMSSAWTSPVSLFTPSGSNGYLGITYDFTNSSIWVSEWNAGVVEDYSPTGSLLGSFNVSFTSITALAMDYTDNTLWMGSQNTPGVFYHYSPAGAFLGQQTFAGISQNTLGGEFQAVPEESPFICFAVAGLIFACAGRRSR